MTINDPWIFKYDVFFHQENASMLVSYSSKYLSSVESSRVYGELRIVISIFWSRSSPSSGVSRLASRSSDCGTRTFVDCGRQEQQRMWVKLETLFKCPQLVLQVSLELWDKRPKEGGWWHRFLLFKTETKINSWRTSNYLINTPIPIHIQLSTNLECSPEYLSLKIYINT